MTAIEKIRELLPRMSDTEKAELVHAVAAQMRDHVPGIEVTPGVCGGNPRIVRTRIAVWLLEKWRRTGLSDDEMLDVYPMLTRDDLHNAWAYVSGHPDEIEEQIRQQEEA